MRHVEYNDTPEPTGTATHRGVDAVVKETVDRGSSADAEIQQSFREGFGASSGIQPEVAETGGRAISPEMKDDARPDRVPDSVEKENAGLADS